MKTCTYCGKEYPDDATTCPIDHQSLTPDSLAATASPAGRGRSQGETAAPSSSRQVKPALMVKLRSLHLYLGCIFAPMLLFFAISGIWQTLGVTNDLPVLRTLSTIHMLAKTNLKGGGLNLSSPLFFIFNTIMALAFIVTTILGIVMALNYGRRRAAAYCLTFGVAVPLLFILIRLL